MTREELKLESINEAATKIYSRFLNRNYRVFKEIEPNTDDWNKAIRIGNTIFDAKISMLSKLKEQLPDDVEIEKQFTVEEFHNESFKDDRKVYGAKWMLSQVKELLTIKE